MSTSWNMAKTGSAVWKGAPSHPPPWPRWHLPCPMDGATHTHAKLQAHLFTGHPALCVCVCVHASLTCKALRAEVWSRCALEGRAAPREPQGAPGPQAAGPAGGRVYQSALQRVRADRHVTGWAFLSVLAWWACPHCTSQTQCQVLPAPFLSPVGPEAQLGKGPVSAVLTC